MNKCFNIFQVNIQGGITRPSGNSISIFFFLGDYLLLSIVTALIYISTNSLHLCSREPLLTFCSYCQLIFFLLSLYRTKMDAKKPNKGSFKSFPTLKSKKKPNLTFVKVRILEFHLGKRVVSS